MSGSMRASSAPGSSRHALGSKVTELNIQAPVENRKTQPPPVNNQIIPDELLVSLTSTVCNRSTVGHTAHQRHCKGGGIRRPDAVWHHPLGRKKYKYFLEQPTSLTGAGRDISFLTDSVVTQRKPATLPPLKTEDRSGSGDMESSCVSETLIPEEYRIVKHKGLRSLEFYEDAFTVQLLDDEQKLRVLPSLKPSGRLEVVQLMRMMDDMLEKAGVDQQSEELTELSQMEGLLELVHVEQNIYNIVFHEVIRQVSVGCAERGQLLAKLRQRYQSLLDRIPRHLKALHTEAVAQRALDRRLTEEICLIKTSIQQLSMELSKIRDHDAFVSQQAEHAQQQLAEALEQTQANSDVVQGYHELYELQRARLEAQLVQMTEERDCWKQLTFCVAFKVISVKKLQLVSQLHVCEQSWFKTAEHCVLYLTSKDTDNLNIILELSDHWKEQLSAFMSQLKETENAQYEQTSAIQQGIAEWLTFCITHNKCPDPKYENASLERIHADLKRWSNMLALQCERYQGEKVLGFQQTLSELGHVQERWLNMSLQMFSRHPSPDGEPSKGQQALGELDRVLPELLKQLDMQVSGESGVHRHITSLLGLMESWVSKLGAVIGQPEMSAPVWLKLEKTLCNWENLTEEALRNMCSMQGENHKDKNKSNIYAETRQVLDKVQEFIKSLCSFTDGVNQRLRKELSSIHMAQTRWMIDLLLLMVPDHSENQSQEQKDYSVPNISLQTLDKDAKILTEKLDYFSRYITSFYKLILEERTLHNPHQAEDEDENEECKKLQMECIDWVETCIILLSKVKGGPAEVPARQPATTSRSNDSTSPADSTETLSTAEGHKTHQEGELRDYEEAVVNMIDYDRSIIQRKLGEISVHLKGTDELVVSPVTDEAQKVFSDLSTVGLLQQELKDSELRLQIAEQRALKAEEALQAALEKIHGMGEQLQGLPTLEPKISGETKKTPPPSPQPPVTPSAPPKKTAPETKTTNSTKKTKKR
uniref:axonemal dynein light chain domain-containing protein 1 isoform X2 n=1 Tax=Monopterus albus TaxID=43700 RepID=UPI0009B340AB|nr:axonemal dynein light chain domain-containing protein 1 isoform X2 [Monopterus albus]